MARLPFWLFTLVGSNHSKREHFDPAADYQVLMKVRDVQIELGNLEGAMLKFCQVC